MSRTSTFYSTFPSTNSIPPACFFNSQGIANWLNNHPSFKAYFINYPRKFPYLYPITSSIVSTYSTAYSTANVPLALHVTTLSQYQLMQSQQQITLFQRVYTFNSNAYMNTVNTLQTPIYYSFSSYKELNEYKSAVGLVNKLYPFDIMANATDQYGNQLGWVIPFPI